MMTPEDREKVRAAVAQAESGLKAEIVPCVFAQSSPYPETLWAGAGAAMSAAVAALFLLDIFHPLWLPLSRLILWVPAAGALGAWAGRWCGPVRRALIGEERMKTAVARRAKEVFYDRGVASTSERDGVLIFVSLLERRVVVLADVAVRKKVTDMEWDVIAISVTDLARKGDVAGGLCTAILMTTALLRKAGFGGGAHANELGDEPIEGDGR